jgi:hypothetical protein
MKLIVALPLIILSYLVHGQNRTIVPAGKLINLNGTIEENEWSKSEKVNLSDGGECYFFSP